MITAQQQTEPKSAAGLKKEGLAALSAGNYAGAIQSFAEALILDPADLELAQSLEKAIAESGRPEAAIPILEKALAARPDQDSIRLVLAQCYQHLDMDDKALQTLQRSDSALTRSPVWLFTSAFSLFRLGQYDKAEALFRQVMTVEEMRPAASFFIGNCHFGQHDLAGALPWYESAIRLGGKAQTPALNAYYYNYGLALFRLDRFADAGNAFFEASSLNPSDPLAPYFLGRSQADSGQTQDAIAIFEKVVQAHPDFSPAYYQLGVMYKRAGNETQAKAAFAKVGQIKKAEFEDQRLLGEMRLGNGAAEENK
jgi:tetratricopeptide (TPR) repeat protein